jgi:solute carrier family 35 (UDP-sugar transporter), member A1/2/3
VLPAPNCFFFSCCIIAPIRLAGAVCQKHLQHFGQDSCLFSMEISAISILFLLISILLGSPDGKRLLRQLKEQKEDEGGDKSRSSTARSRIFEGWTWRTWIPIITQASGGIMVGLVTKHAGAVRKGFALIFGMLLSGVLQTCFTKDGRVTKEQIVGGGLAAVSLWMHSKFPPLPR